MWKEPEPPRSGENEPETPRGGEIDPAFPPPDVLARAGARVLDPATATRFPGQVLRPTVYRTNELLVLNSRFTRVRRHLAEAARQLGLTATFPPDVTGYRSAVVVTFEPEPGRTAEVDAWEVLQRARALALGTRRGWPGFRRWQPSGEDLSGVGLNHLMFVGSFGPVPYDSPQPYDPAYPLGSPYADLAYTGPRPVALATLTKPTGPPKDDVETVGRPVVAVIDTGCGEHTWLKDDVDRYPFGRRDPWLPVPASDPDAEHLGNASGRLDGMRDRFAGHGTFICGLVRQACPEAKIVSLPIVDSEGNNTEGALADVLDWIADRDEVDVVSISMGSYLEEDGPNAPWRLPSGNGTGQPDPAKRQAVLDGLLRAIDRLTDKGVVVVAAAGNDATVRKFYPAAFPTVVSVGALNPNRRSITLFSNGGPWIRAWDVGVAVVSTMPKNYQHSLQPPARTVDASTHAERSNVDPDDFRGLFAIASGTSYAAPVTAGRIASRIFEMRRERLTAPMPASDTADGRRLTLEDIAVCVKDSIMERPPPADDAPTSSSKVADT